MKKKLKPARVGDMKQKDYATVAKMDPDQPNIYYGTEDMASKARTLDTIDKPTDPNETLEHHTTRVVNSDTEADVDRRKRILRSVLPPEALHDTDFPFTKFSPTLTEDLNTQGFYTPPKKGASERGSNMRLPANAPPLTTALTAQHEYNHSRGVRHAPNEAVTTMSSGGYRDPDKSPSDGIIPMISSTKRVLQKLIEQGVPEEEAALLITQNLERPKGTSIFGEYNTAYPNSWKEYERDAPDDLKKLRASRSKGKAK